MTTIIAEYRKRVKRGAAALDKAYPSWAKRVSIKRLEMADGAYCVIAQLHDSSYDPLGFFEEHINGKIEKMLNRAGGSAEFGPYYGFDLTGKDMRGSADHFNGFDLLRDLWVTEIRARR